MNMIGKTLITAAAVSALLIGGGWTAAAIEHATTPAPVTATEAAPTIPSGSGAGRPYINGLATEQEAEARPVRYAAVGDSITWWGPNADGSSRADISWTTYTTAAGLQFEGGWSLGGAQTSLMADNMPAVPNAEVLVVMGGTNDVAGFPVGPIATETTLANISRIVANSGVSHVLISAIAPGDRWTAEFAAFNVALQQYAAAQGWDWTDPWVDVRDTDQSYIEGTTLDGIHPTPATAKLVGERIAATLDTLSF